MLTAGHLVLAAVCIPWVVLLATLALHSRDRLRDLIALGGGIALFVAVLGLLPAVLDGRVVTVRPLEFVTGVSFGFRADAAGVFFGLVVSSLWPLATTYAAGYLEATDAHSRTRFFAAYAASIGAVIGVAFAANLLTLFVFFELLTIATYPLVVHKGTSAARQAGKKYIAYTLGGGVAVFAGTVILYALTGSVSFDPGGIAGLAGADPTLARVAFALLVAGFGVKAALMPLHGWLPSAMVAPTPVSGLLHAVAVVKCGVFGIGRVVLYVFGPEQVASLGVGAPLAVVAGITMVLAGFLALQQDRLKRGLAYSTVSQLSYIVVGIAVLAPGAVRGAFLHFAAHAFMKFALFLCAGVIYVETHVERIEDLAGIAERLPVTMTLFGIASAGLVGLPLVAGFVSKLHLLTGLVAGAELLFAAALIVAGLLKLLFFWPVLAAAFDTGQSDARSAAATGLLPDGGATPGDPDGSTSEEEGGDHDRSNSTGTRFGIETRWELLVPIAVAVLVAVVFGIVPTWLPFYELASDIVGVTIG